jgi:hypothetical protein
MAPCAPTDGLALTVMLTVLFSGSTTLRGAENVPSLPSQLSSCRMLRSGPLVRVSLTVYALFTPAFCPPLAAVHRL